MKIHNLMSIALIFSISCCKKNSIKAEDTSQSNEQFLSKSESLKEDLKKSPPIAYSYIGINFRGLDDVQIRIIKKTAYDIIIPEGIMNVSPVKREEVSSKAWQIYKINTYLIDNPEDLVFEKKKSDLHRQIHLLTRKTRVASIQEIRDFMNRVSKKQIVLDKRDFLTIETIIKKTIYTKKKVNRGKQPIKLLTSEERKYLRYYRTLAEYYPNQKLNGLVEGLTYQDRLIPQ